MIQTGIIIFYFNGCFNHPLQACLYINVQLVEISNCMVLRSLRILLSRSQFQKHTVKI